jgi:ABC-2 type transport system ATP-binding protein
MVGVMLGAAATRWSYRHRDPAAHRTTARDADREPETLEQVGLGEAAKRRVGDYSLGMRQRLGIGTALMGDPAVLILDEPANGMDPEGIRWMRLLLNDFAERGGTVLLSSHLLAEVQATVDRLVVIRAGRIVADDSLASLLAGQGTTVRGLDQRALEGASAPRLHPGNRTARCACRPRPSRSAVSPLRPIRSSSNCVSATVPASRSCSSN